jgi:hypothetical protein
MRVWGFFIFFLSAVSLLAQWGGGDSIRANIRGGGGDRGKCTAEVEVDEVAEVSIRGDEGRIRTLSGTPARWRRLDCNAAMPFNPGDFRFTGIDGRGRMTLIVPPNGNNGAAVVRIEDPKNGREGYTFDLEWRGSLGGPGPGGGSWGPGGGGGSWGPGSGGGGWNNGWGNTLSYRGRGSGNFDRDGGPRYDVRGVDVNMSRSGGNVTVVMDTDAGRDTLRFIGRIQRIGGDTVYANIESASNQGSQGQASGDMRITVSSDRRVRSMNLNGTVANRRFRLSWSE